MCVQIPVASTVAEQAYKLMHQQFLHRLQDEVEKTGLMSVDKKRKWDACSELVNLKKFYEACVVNATPRHLFSWAFRRILEIQRGCECY